MALLLLGEALAQRLHQLVETELLDLGPLLGAEIPLGHAAQPFLRQISRLDRRGERERAFEGRGEDDVELVEIALVLDEQSAREPVEFVDRHLSQIALKRAHQIEIFARRDRHMHLAQIGEELEKHGLDPSVSRRRRAMLGAGAP